MEPIRIHQGLVAPLERADIDTDQIIPKQFLKRIERTGYGDFLFYDWRFGGDGQPIAAFPLNQPRYQRASILVTGRNFGCGSSREHAAWALRDFGFRVVLAPSFADIFANNALNNGLAAIVLAEDEVKELIRRAQQVEGYSLTVDLPAGTVRDGQGFAARFEMDAFRKRRLVEGLDDIGLSLEYASEIQSYERGRPAFRPAIVAEGKTAAS